MLTGTNADKTMIKYCYIVV